MRSEMNRVFTKTGSEFPKLMENDGGEVFVAFHRFHDGYYGAVPLTRGAMNGEEHIKPSELHDFRGEITLTND